MDIGVLPCIITASFYYKRKLFLFASILLQVLFLFFMYVLLCRTPRLTSHGTDRKSLLKIKSINLQIYLSTYLSIFSGVEFIHFAR